MSRVLVERDEAFDGEAVGFNCFDQGQEVVFKEEKARAGVVEDAGVPAARDAR